jgi:TonB family protein
VLLVVVGYLLFGRASAPPALDQQAQQKLLGDLVQSEIAKQLEERERKLRDELEAQRTQNEALRKQIEQQQASARGGAQRLTSEEQQRLDQAQRDLAAREAAQRQKESELAKVQAQRAQVAAAVPTAAPVVSTEVPIQAPVVARAAGGQPAAPAAAVEPTSAPLVATPTPEPAIVEPPPVGLGAGVREGDYVEFAQVDIPPQELVTERPVLPRAAVVTRAGKGVVILSALVNEKGGVDSVEVLRGFPISRLGVDEACVDAIKRYRYRPATKGGVKVKTKLTVTLQVDLTKGR